MVGDPTPARPELRLMPPARRSALPRWSVWLDGVRIGEIQQKHLEGARLPFYEAIAAHPRTGKPFSLELHTSIDNRVETLMRFHVDPESYRRHWN